MMAPRGGPAPGGRPGSSGRGSNPHAGGPMGALGRPVEKAKDFRGSLLRLLGYLKPHRLNLIAVFLFAIISTIFSIVSPKIMGNATTKIFQGMIAKFAALKMHLPPPPMDFTYIGHIVLILIGLY